MFITPQATNGIFQEGHPKFKVLHYSNKVVVVEFQQNSNKVKSECVVVDTR